MRNTAVPEERDSTNIRNGTRPKTVLTEATGHVEIEVPRDRDGSFEIVLPLYAKELTTVEITAHFAEIYGASWSKETISQITDKVVEEMIDWANRPLDGGSPLSVGRSRWRPCVYTSGHALGIQRHKALGIAGKVPGC